MVGLALALAMWLAAGAAWALDTDPNCQPSGDVLWGADPNGLNLMGFGTEVVGTGLVDPGDNIEDIAVAYGVQGGGVAILSGADLSLIRTITSPTGIPHSFGTTLAYLPQNLLAVAAPYETGSVNKGPVYLFHMGPTSSPLFAKSDYGLCNPPNCLYGYAMSTGDVDGDGLADLLIGGPSFAGSSGWGVVDVISGFDGSLLRRLRDADYGNLFGLAVAGLGDLDGNGTHEFAVGDPNFEVHGMEGAGRVLVFSCDASVSDPNDGCDVVAELNGPQPNAHFGWAVSGGDLNGDGTGDLVATAPGYDERTGAAIAYSGRTMRELFKLGGTTEFDRFGTCAHPAGDFNGDGLGDVFLTSIFPTPPNKSSQNDRGQLGVYSGEDGSLLFRRDADVTYLDICAAATFDQNQDALSDVVLGLWDEHTIEVYEGFAPNLDVDNDCILNAVDNCPLTANQDQSDLGGMGMLSLPDGIGDACQCGDVDGDGRVTSFDATATETRVTSNGSRFQGENCNVAGPLESVACNLDDAHAMRRSAAELPPAMLNICGSQRP